MNSVSEEFEKVSFLSTMRGKIILFAGFLIILLSVFIYYILEQNFRLEKLIRDKRNLVITIDTVNTVAISVGVFFVFAIVIFSVWLIWSFNKSIKVPLQVMTRLANGNTETTKNFVHDEMGNLVRVANQVAQNLQLASSFTKQIGEGNLSEDFQPVSDHDVLGNSLLQMRNKLKDVSEDDNRRNWITKGLAFFGDLMRKYSDDYTALTEQVIIELVKYVRAHQGGLFVLNTDDNRNTFLMLQACYAYGRKKYLDKRIYIGEGLVGQCYLEKTSIFLKEVPTDYTYITSGLGDGRPSSVLIVPLLANDEVEGVIELASFHVFKPHEIEFVEKISEQIAVMITSVKVKDKTKDLLEQSQQQAEEMRAQEEEMRQNMEELQATQDNLQRQTDEMRNIQDSLQVEKSMFQVLMEYLPDRITYKDTQSRILRINQAKAARMKMTSAEVEGKTDYDFFSKEHADKAMKEERELIRSGKPLLDIEERLTFGEEVNWVSTSRIPFRNEQNQVSGMFIITKDITRLRVAEMALSDYQKLKKFLFDNFAFIEYKITKDGIITDVHTGKVDFSVLWNGKHIRDISDKIFNALQDESRQEFMIADVLTLDGKNISSKHSLMRTSASNKSFIGLMIITSI